MAKTYCNQCNKINKNKNGIWVGSTQTIKNRHGYIIFKQGQEFYCHDCLNKNNLNSLYDTFDLIDSNPDLAMKVFNIDSKYDLIIFKGKIGKQILSFN